LGRRFLARLAFYLVFPQPWFFPALVFPGLGFFLWLAQFFVSGPKFLDLGQKSRLMAVI
jgi:hypothetical protein